MDVLIVRIEDEATIVDRLVLTGGPNDIADEIDRFNNLYHQGFLKVRAKSIQYVYESMRNGELTSFAEDIADVLKEWGAGCHTAPFAAELTDMVKVLQSGELKEGLRKYIDNGWIVYLHGSEKEITDNNQRMLSLLTLFHNHFLLGNTNITYPTKLLLLFSGLSVGFDRNVKDGLSHCGIQGFKQNSYLLPASVKENSAVKLFNLNAVLARCWCDNIMVFQEGVRRSNHRYLASYLNSPARVMDILLFNGGGLFRYGS